MNLDPVRRGLGVRFAEARQLLIAFAQSEHDRQPLDPIQPLALVLRGHLFVSLYGALEYSVTQAIQEFWLNFSEIGVAHAHLELPLHSVVLDPELTALSTKVRRKWQSRVALFKSTSSESTCRVNETVFSSTLQNITWTTIEEIFDCLSITSPPTPNIEDRGYLDEVKDKRNRVAHGRGTCAEVGEGRTSGDLERTARAVFEVSMYFIAQIEAHFETRGFLLESKRALYPAN